MPVITQLWVYPIKSCQGVSLPSVEVLPSGFRHDREMMIVDESGRFVTQRSDVILAHIGVALPDENHVQLRFAERTLRFEKQYTQPVTAEVWRRNVPAFDQGDAVADFLSPIIGCKVRLLATRPDDTLNAEKSILFQDGQAIHLLSEASLQHAQQSLSDYDIDVRRFRPNIVVGEQNGEHITAFAEDDWQHVQTEQVALQISKLCERCAVPGINPQTLDREKAVYAYFKQHRLKDKKPMFGVCGHSTKAGILTVGDTLNVG